MEEKFHDKYGKILRQGWYVQESVKTFNSRFNEYLNLGEDRENIHYFTGKFDSENGRPIFTSYPISKEFTDNQNQHFCGLLRAIDKNEIEFVKEPAFRDRILNWISSFA